MKDLSLTKEEILNRIGYFRNKKNITAYKLGKELGHAKTYMYRIESGEIQLTIDLLLDILDILGVSTTEFFYPNLQNYDKDKIVLDILNQMSDEERNSLVTLLKIKK